MDAPWDDQRREMVETQLAARGIVDPRVLTAMARVPRERFLPPELRRHAYDDCALPIDCRQTISQPYIVALMTEALGLVGHERVLEVGTGSGYQAAVLAELARDVLTIERHAALSHQAQRTLTELGYENIQFEIGDGTKGYPPAAPYDGIVVAAAAAQCPPALWEQLVEGGTLVIPLGPPGDQVLQAIRKRHGRPDVRVLSPCRFVPLIGAQGESDAGRDADDR